MGRKKIACSCKGLADQYMTLVTIYAAIINQEFQDPDELEIFAEFLVSLGEQLSLAAAVRGRCEDENFEVDVDESLITSLVDDFHRTYKSNENVQKEFNKSQKNRRMKR